MSDQIITGEIHFFRVPLPVELEELTVFLSRRAAENRIWINTGERIRNPDARYKCSVNDNGDEKYLAENISRLKSLIHKKQTGATEF